MAYDNVKLPDNFLNTKSDDDGSVVESSGNQDSNVQILAKTVKTTLQSIGKGVTQAVDKIIDAPAAIYNAGLSNDQYKKNSGYSTREKAAIVNQNYQENQVEKHALGEGVKNWEETVTQNQQDIVKNNPNSKIAQTAGKAFGYAETIGFMAPTIAASVGAGILTGGSSTIAQIAGLGTMALGVYDQSFENSISQGYDADVSGKKAFGDAALEVATELMFSGIAGVAGTGTGIVNKLVKSPTSTTLTKKLGVKNAVLTVANTASLANKVVENNVVGRLLKNAAGEGIEEMVAEALSPLIERATTNPDADFATVNQIIEAGIGGAIVSFAMAPLGTVQTGVAKVTNKIADNRIQAAKEAQFNTDVNSLVTDRDANLSLMNNLIYDMEAGNERVAAIERQTQGGISAEVETITKEKTKGRGKRARTYTEETQRKRDTIYGLQDINNQARAEGVYNELLSKIDAGTRAYGESYDWQTDVREAWSQLSEIWKQDYEERLTSMGSQLAANKYKADILEKKDQVIAAREELERANAAFEEAQTRSQSPANSGASILDGDIASLSKAQATSNPQADAERKAAIAEAQKISAEAQRKYQQIYREQSALLDKQIKESDIKEKYGEEMYNAFNDQTRAAEIKAGRVVVPAKNNRGTVALTKSEFVQQGYGDETSFTATLAKQAAERKADVEKFINSINDQLKVSGLIGNTRLEAISPSEITNKKDGSKRAYIADFFNKRNAKAAYNDGVIYVNSDALSSSQAANYFLTHEFLHMATANYDSFEGKSGFLADIEQLMVNHLGYDYRAWEKATTAIYGEYYVNAAEQEAKRKHLKPNTEEYNNFVEQYYSGKIREEIDARFMSTIFGNKDLASVVALYNSDLLQKAKDSLGNSALVGTGMSKWDFERLKALDTINRAMSRPLDIESVAEEVVEAEEVALKEMATEAAPPKEEATENAGTEKNEADEYLGKLQELTPKEYQSLISSLSPILEVEEEDVDALIKKARSDYRKQMRAEEKRAAEDGTKKRRVKKGELSKLDEEQLAEWLSSLSPMEEEEISSMDVPTEDMFTDGEINPALTPEQMRQYQELIDTYGEQSKDGLPNKINYNHNVSQYANRVYNKKITNTALKEQMQQMLMEGALSHLAWTDATAMGYAYQQIGQFSKLSEAYDSAMSYLKVKSSVPSKNDIAFGQQMLIEILDRYNELDEFNKKNPTQQKDLGQLTDMFEKLLAELCATGTRAGQQLQAMALIKKMTPQGRLYYIESQVGSLLDELAGTREMAVDRRGNSKVGGFGYLKDSKGNIKLDPETGYPIQIKISDELREQMLNATTLEELDAVEELIIQDIARQIPPRLSDRVSAWRYLAMLGNPRTHVRNIVSNYAMGVAVKMKDKVGGTMEDMFLGKRTSGRTKTNMLTVDGETKRALKEFAIKDWEADDVKDVAMSGGKVGFQTRINQERRKLGFSDNSLLDKASKLNMNVLEIEDDRAGKRAYKNAFVRYCAANNLTVDYLSSNTVESNVRLAQARAWAISEAAKATYHDANALATHLNDIEKKGGMVSELIVGGLVPFKKTPMNILKRGIEYSPVGLVNGIGKAFKATRAEKSYNATSERLRAAEEQVEIVKAQIAAKQLKPNCQELKSAEAEVRKARAAVNASLGLIGSEGGGYTAGTNAEAKDLKMANLRMVAEEQYTRKICEAIDRIASGLTGTGLLMLGMFLAHAGLMKGGGSDNDREEYYDEMLGNQKYSITINGTNYTLDWLTPISIPLFAGVELMEAILDDGDNEDEPDILGSAFDAVSKLADPVMNLSVLQGLNDALGSYDSGLGKVVLSSVESYAGQFIPTLSGQIARSVDGTRRTTYAPKTSEGSTAGKELGTFINRLENKIPGLSKRNAEYVDMWGRTESTGDTFIGRLFANSVAPWYSKEQNKTEADDIVSELFANTGDRAVIPTSPESKYTFDKKNYYLSSEDYETTKKSVGQISYAGVTSLMDTPGFSDLDDDMQVTLVSKVYEYARAVTKKDYADTNNLDFETQSGIDKISQAVDLGMPLGTAVYVYTVGQTVDGEKDENGKTITGTKKAAVLDFYRSCGLTAEQAEILLPGNYVWKDSEW